MSRSVPGLLDAKELLIDYMQGLEIIDAHEHLEPESVRLRRQADVLTLLSIYAHLDLASAGLPARDGASICLDTSIPLDERWQQVWPYLRQIKYGSYYRATAIALRDIYGIDDLNERTYREASSRISAANKKGLYNSILRDRCKIRTCLVQNGRIEEQDPPELFTPVYVGMFTYDFLRTAGIEALHREQGVEVSDLDTYLAVLGRHLEDVRRRGAVGFKMESRPQVAPDMCAAREAYKQAMKGGPVETVLESTVLDFILRKAAGWDWPVASHCGIWGDIRVNDPKHMIDLAVAHPGVRFELYHLGIPFARDCIFIAKKYANVYLNLCWCYAISQEITGATISEILDAVPVNKVIGFGGDYCWDVENTYGHLVMARETIAGALARRIAQGLLDVEGARHIIRLWLWDNPCRFYGFGPP